MIFNSQRELFDYALNYDLNSIVPLSDLLKSYELKYIDINELENALFDNNTLIIDARSPKEFNETHIPGAVNFPVLDNEERHNVGLVYKKYSDMAALKLAMEYADPKMPSLSVFLKQHSAPGKNIIVHCWRGGGRSKYLSKMIIDSGYDVRILSKGIKSYRNKAVKYFSLNAFPFSLLEISGQTGTGKTEVIRSLSDSLPALDLEKSARHFSSLFGIVPYKIRDIEPVYNQTAFENNIYAEIIHNRYFHKEKSLYFVESESKKVGDFFIPAGLYKEIEEAKTIRITSSFENRITRIVNDYFGDDNRGLPLMEEIMIDKERFFRKELSSDTYFSALVELNKGNPHGFTEIMLKYYDSKYKEKPKSPLAVVSSDNMDECVSEIKKIYEQITG